MLSFKKVQISDAAFESAAFMDVNGNGILDIVSGEWWYEGPEFTQKHFIGTVMAEGEYYDDFSTIPMDVNGNGRIDFITGGWWGNTLRWRENPGDPEKEWLEHIIAETGNVETTRAWDVDGDGQMEIVPNTPNGPLIVYKPDGNGGFDAYKIWDGPQGHGLGCGDINGNGCMDFVLKEGWLEAPESPWDEEWIWHPDFDLGSASIPVIVTDINQDGRADLIVGQSHAYGLSWWEQSEKGWQEHPIDPDASQYHDMIWIDIDGDGACELVTGKRYRAHCGNEPGSTDSIGIYYFKWNGTSFDKNIIDYGEPEKASGCGIYFDARDITGNGFPDILAPGKDGLYIFYNQGA